MNAEQLRNAIWKMDDKFIAEAETYEPETTRSTKPIWIITSASAAVIAIISCVNLFNTFGNDHRPEISNYVVTTTVTDEAVTEAGKTTEKTEKSAETTVAGSSSDVVDLNTEVTETETGFDSSVPDAATVPEKTEAPSGNGGSSGEKTVLTERTHEVTEVPETEPVVNDSPPDTEMTVYPFETVPAPIASPSSVDPPPVNTTISLPVSLPGPAGELVTTTERPTSPSSESETTIPVYTDVTNIWVTGYSEVSIEDFPMYLMTSDGVRYDRAEIMYSEKVGRFIKQDVMTDVYGNSYTVDVYLLDGFYGDTIRIFYFYNKECYVSYKKDKNN